MHLYVEPMDAVVVEVTEAILVRLEHEGWFRLCGSGAILFAAHGELWR
jgi:hypothetical protein